MVYLYFLKRSQNYLSLLYWEFPLFPHHIQLPEFWEIVISLNQNLYPRFFHLCAVFQRLSLHPCLSDLSIRVTTEKWRKLTTSLVLQVFRDGDASVVKNIVFLGGSSLSAQTYSSSVDVQKFATLRLFIVSKRANNRWKEERVFYNYCIRIPIRFQVCQYQNWIFWLLLTVKSDLMSVSEIFVLKFSWWIQGWTPVVLFQHHDGTFILFRESLLECYNFDSPIAWV
jgi:hypothetical protein